MSYKYNPLTKQMDYYESGVPGPEGPEGPQGPAAEVANVITVSSSGGDFTSIKAALDSITDNDSTHRYVVQVAPGVYTENNPIQGKEYVTLVSMGDLQTTRITAAVANNDLFIMSNFFTVTGFTFWGVTGVNNYAINQEVAGIVGVTRCAFGECSNGIHINNAGASFTLENSTVYNLTVTSGRGIYLEAGNLTVDKFNVALGNVTTLIEITGASSIATLNHVSSFVSTLGTGIFVRDLSRVVINNASIVGMTNGLVVEGAANAKMYGSSIFNAQNDGFRINDTGGAATNVTIQSSSIEDSTDFDINILSENAYLSGSGKTSIDKIYFVPGAQMYGIIIDLKEADEGTNIFGELHVGIPELGTEAVFGQGDSYTRGMLVYTETDVGVFADVTIPAASPSASTFTFTGTGADHAIYVASSLTNGTDVLLHHGLKIAINSAAVLGSGNIISEYWNGSSWVELNSMVTDSSVPFLPYGKDYFSKTGGYQIRYDVLRMNDSTWTKNDPMTLGTSYYWVRFRIVTAITTAPIFQLFKLHSSRAEVNSDGFHEFFGNARPYLQLPISVGTGKPFEGNMQNQTVYMDENIGVGYQQNRFTATGDKYGWELIMPNNIDTSTKLAFRFFGRPTVTETIEWTIRWTWINPDGTLYVSEPGSGTNPNSKTTTVSKAVTVGILEWFEVYLDISGIIARRDTEFPDLMMVSIQPSTMGGAFDIMGVQAYYLVWGVGGHAD